MEREEYEKLKAKIEEEHEKKLDALDVLFPEFAARPPPNTETTKSHWKAPTSRKNEVKNSVSKETLVELYVTQQKTIDEVATEIGKSPSRVRQMLFNEGIVIRSRGASSHAAQKKSAEQKVPGTIAAREKVLKLFAEGRTVPQIIDKTGLEAKIINRILEQPRQPREGSSQGPIKTLEGMNPEERTRMRQLYGNQERTEF